VSIWVHKTGKFILLNNRSRIVLILQVEYLQLMINIT